MKQRFLCFLPLLPLMLVCVVIHQQAFAGQILYVNNTQVNVRSAPTAADTNIVTTLIKDTPVEVLSQKGSWYRVRLPNGNDGWISERVLVPRGGQQQSRGNIRPSENFTEDVAIQEISPIESVVTPEISPIETTAGRSTIQTLEDDMVFVQGGTAIIGSDEGEIHALLGMEGASQDMFADELPRKQINLQGFYIDRYEVTNAQYKKFVDATRYPPPLNWEDGMYPLGTSKHPVTFISWDDAQAYATWVGKRLPTAEEWEVASRGPHGQTYPWGEAFDMQKINIYSAQGGPDPVGSNMDDVSKYKIYDLGGNVMEWTLTHYEGDKNFFILKGGSWAGKPFEARGANNTPGEAVYQLSHIGFRCAKSVN
ncbi:hypothetical protein CSA56_17770 [candidate division KSB3 bacterium]|uniref:SH3b domain-containing protein n=1 Tax=candidate division KSB3 bacterium TaxID=2044937 RepID=A0A2G6K7J7_9BACT|nr:MAG: hypothetical protein CSA56_17770 [candidate division KSB3 bacterium]